MNRKLVELEQEYKLIIYKEVYPQIYKKYEKIIQKKIENSLQPNQGWACENKKVGLHTGRNYRIRGERIFHYFRKDDNISLCGQIIIKELKRVIFRNAERTRERNCKSCERIKSNWNDLANFSHEEYRSESRLFGEW